MKISIGIQNVLVKKLSEALERTLSLSHFNEAFLYLDKCNNTLKIVPYGVFENEEYLKMLDNTEEGVVFNSWLDKTTGNITTEFNKGRKLVRVFKELVDSNHSTLAFNLAANNLFTVSLTSLFIKSVDEMPPLELVIEDKERLNKTLHLLRGYFASIFYINSLSDPLDVENLISLFINGDIDNLIDDVVKLALKTNVLESL